MSGRRFNPAMAFPTYGSVVSHHKGFQERPAAVRHLGSKSTAVRGGKAGVLGMNTVL
ncbi:MAG: hypothetical protein Ct9H300mP1_07740 [Planctomycetaceae bacterium]|nr:MAG: hypothetical protein Ct9H300mP1_07740 [Planctomycetaceae bacterium]